MFPPTCSVGETGKPMFARVSYKLLKTVTGLEGFQLGEIYHTGYTGSIITHNMKANLHYVILQL